jgi:hypothetical protein
MRVRTCFCDNDAYPHADGTFCGIVDTFQSPWSGNAGLPFGFPMDFEKQAEERNSAILYLFTSLRGFSCPWFRRND